MQMPAAVHSIPRTSELIPHGLLLWDLGLFHPLWVWLQTQRDLANFRIWVAFLCAHCCPFPHTCRKYPNDLIKTLWATTSNDELWLAADKIALPAKEEVHEVSRFYYFHACAGAPNLILDLHQVRDTPQVNWEALAEMYLSAIRIWENPPRCQVAIRCTIVLKCHSNPRCLPISIRIMPASFYIPSTLLKHLVKCISLQGPLVYLALLQSIQDEQGVHSPSISEQVVSHPPVSILTTSTSSRALQFGSSSVLHPVECQGLLSRWHALNFSLRNTVHCRCAFPSQY